MQRMGKILGMFSASVFGFFAPNAFAVTDDVPFNATVGHTCTINVTQDGTIAPNANFRRLRSFGPGTPGRADVTASGGGFSVSVDAPTAFNTEPAADVTTETFRAWHRSNGATVYGNSQTPVGINAGLNRIRVHMDARKGAGNVFEAGNYSATVVLRCE